MSLEGSAAERDQDAGPTAEAYNPAKNEWRIISSMKVSMELYGSAVIDYKFDVVNSSSENRVGLVYDPKQDEWVYMAHGLNTGWQSKTAAMNRMASCMLWATLIHSKARMKFQSTMERRIRGKPSRVFWRIQPLFGPGVRSLRVWVEDFAYCWNRFATTVRNQAEQPWLLWRGTIPKTDAKSSASLQFYEDITGEIEFAGSTTPGVHVKS